MVKRIISCLVAAVLILSCLPFAVFADDAEDEGYEAMQLDVEYTAVIESDGGMAYFTFTADVTGTYQFYSVGDDDTYCYVYDSDGNLVAEDDDSGENLNACITVDLDAGETVTVGFRHFDNSAGSFSVYVSAYEIDYTCGDDAQWYVEDGTLYITGNGAMYDYEQLVAGPWRDLLVDEITSIVIGEGITYIGTYAFWYMYNVTSVTISSTVETIADGAFDTIFASEIVIPESVTYIGGQAFINCLDLKSLVINAENVTIDGMAFQNCSSLESLTINSEDISIGEYAFAYCTALENIVINAQSVDLGHYAFMYCTSLVSAEINGQAQVHECAFYMCYALSNVYIESGYVYDYAFEQCYGLSEISGGAEIGDLPIYNTPVNDWAEYSSEGMTICYTTDLTELIASVTVDGEELGEDGFSTEYDGTYTYIYIGSDVFSSLSGGVHTVSVSYEFDGEIYEESFSITIDGILSASYEDGVLTLSSDYYRTIYYGDEALDAYLADIDLSEIVTLNIEGYIYYIDPEILYQFENLSEVNVSEDCLYTYEYSYEYVTTDDDGVVWTIWGSETETYGMYMEDGILYYIYQTESSGGGESEYEGYGWASGGGYGPERLWPAESDEDECEEHSWWVSGSSAEEDDLSDVVLRLTCSECGSTITVDATAQLIGEDEVSCTEMWYTYYIITAEYDGETYIQELNLPHWGSGHSWDEGTVTTEATAKEDGEITYTCTVCGDTYTETIPASGEGIFKDSDTGSWYYYVDGAVDYTYTGFAENSSGTWYVEEGTVTFEYTGLVEDEDGTSWYVSASKVSTDSGIKKINGTWYYLEDGAVASDYTGLAQNSSGMWYVEEGIITFEFTGLITDEDGAVWYVSESKVSTYTGIKKISGTWYYLESGCVASDYTGLAENEYGTWYVGDGVIDFGYTGIYEDTDGTLWYVLESKVMTSKSGIKKIDGTWYLLEDGAVASDYTGLSANDYGTWYIEEGVITFGYTGLAEDEDGTTWYVYQSKVQETKTSVLKVNGVWYYVVDGVVQYDYTGLASNSSGTWYVEDGVVTLTYNGTVTIDGTAYTIVNSRVKS